MTKAIVIYYDGNENRAAVLDVPKHVGPGSAQPHVWGLPDDVTINAVVACTLDSEISETFSTTSHNWHELVDVYVEEVLHVVCGEEQDL